MRNILLTILILCVCGAAFGQTTVTFPALETDNIFSGQDQFLLGATLGPTTFGQLGTPANGKEIYCSDCTQADPCVGGGTGAFAKRINGAWSCTNAGGGGGGGVGDALLHPPSDETFQATAPTVKINFQCPVGAASGFSYINFLDTDSSNIMKINCGTKAVIFGDGISGSWTASFFARSTGTVASGGSSPLLRDTDTGCAVGWRNHADSGDDLMCKDNTDVLNFSGFSAIKYGSNFMVNAPATTVGRALIATSTDGQARTSNGVIYADDPSFAVGAGVDVCKIINNAEHAAVLDGKQTVDARGLSPGTEMSCKSNPTDDNYSGEVLLPVGRIWLESNAAIFMLHSRVHYKGVTEGRSASGPTSGTIISACNEANGAAYHSSACEGTTFNPTASNLCTDGDGTTVSCPLMVWSVSANPGLPVTQMFATTIEDLTVACNSVSGCIGIQGGTFPLSHAPLPVCSGKCGPQENSYIRNVRIEDWGTGAGRAIVAKPGTSNFQIEGINALNENVTIADCSAAVPIEIVFDSSINANGPKRVDNVTTTNGGCTTKPANGLLLDAGEVRVNGFHCENLTESCIEIGSQADVQGFNIANANGVTSGASTSVIHINSGHTVGGVATGTVNVNVAGFTILDDVHGNAIRIDCESETAFYGFNAGLDNLVMTSAPCVPHATVVSAPWITNVVLASGDMIRLVGGSTSFQVTKNSQSSNLKIKPLGIAAGTIPDTVVRVPVIVYGPAGVGGIPTVTLTSGTCAAGDFVYGSGTDGEVLCAATRPDNIAILGTALKDVSSAPNPVPMFVNPLEPGEGALSECVGTASGGPPPTLNCAANKVGLVKCPHSASGSTCTISNTTVTATSIILLQLDQSITTGCDATYALPLQISTRSAGTNFVLPIGTLGGTDGICFSYRIINP